LAWMEKIERETNGRVKIIPFWNASLLGKRENLTQVVKGVVDIGCVIGNYAATGFDIAKSVKGFFYGCPNRQIARTIYEKVRAKYPQIDGEFSEVKVLAYQAHTPYQLITNKPISRVEDLEGLSLGVTGIYAKVAEALGAEGMAMPIGDFYMAFEKGILDGGILPIESLKSFRFAEVLKYCTLINITAAPIQHRVMNLECWRKLPPDIQKVFEDNIEWWGLKIEEELFKAEAASIDYARKEGVTFSTLPPDQMNRFLKILGDAVNREAEKLDAEGIPATGIHNEIQRLIAEYRHEDGLF
jgi:TRAP-type C4-dicarboxylate transport system substrate-binding protein